MAALEKAASQDDGPIASINIIPFVDIVLVLLVIFIVTSAAIVRASLKVDLPRAAAGGAKVASTLNLVLDREGRWRWTVTRPRRSQSAPSCRPRSRAIRPPRP